MNCQEFLRLLNEDLPARGGDAGAHLEECPSCRTALESWEAARRELHAMRDEPIPPFLHARVMAHLRAAHGARRPWWRGVPRLVWAGPALVAILLVAVSGYRIWQFLQPALTLAPKSTALPADRLAEAPPLLAARAEDGEKVAEMPPPAAGPVSRRQSAASPSPSRNRRKEAPRVTAPLAPVFAPAPPLDVMVERKQLAAALPGVAPATNQADGAADGVPTNVEGNVPAGPPAAQPVGAAAMKGASAASPHEYLADEVNVPRRPVACELRSSATGQTAHLLLPDETAPPAGAVWLVEIAPEGAVMVRDARREPVLAARAPVMVAIGTLRLPHGAYLLRRAVP